MSKRSRMDLARDLYRPLGCATPIPPARTCQWIIGELSGPRCGRPVRPGSSWCPDHYARVFHEDRHESVR